MQFRYPILALSIALSSISCAPASSNKDDPPALVTSVPADGFVVVTRTGIGVGPAAIHLFDPTTGKASATEVNVTSNTAIAISPDGQRIAWNNSVSSIQVAEVAMEGGLPAFHVIKDIPNATVSTLAWNPEGTRLYSTDLWINPETGAVYPCEMMGMGGPANYPIIAFHGNRYLCGSTNGFYEDGRYIGVAYGYEDTTSADGQFLDHTFHIPTGTKRPFVPESDYEPRWANGGERHRKLPDSRFLLVPNGVHGDFVSQQPAGFGWTYTVLTSDTLPLDGAFYDYPSVFKSGQFKPLDGGWKLKDALSPWFNEGKGRSYRVAGISTDGTKVVYAITSWIIEASSQGDGALYETPMSSAFVEVAQDGSNRAFATKPLADGHVALVASSELTDFGDGEWLSTAVTQMNSTLNPTLFGYVGGKAVRFYGMEKVTPDGRWMYGLSADPKLGNVYCFRQRTDSKSSCIKQPGFGAVLGFMGQGTHSEFANQPPTVIGLSRPAAFPGASVIIYGAHFGTSGTVKVGDVSVPASDVTAWTDHAITITMSNALPTQGRIHVTNAAGTGGDLRLFQLNRTELVTTPFDRLKETNLVLRQGLNAVDIGEPDAFIPLTGSLTLTPAARDANGKYVVFSEGSDTARKADVTLHSGDYSHPLRFSIEPGLADSTKWQPVEPTVVDSTTKGLGFVTLAGDLVERSTKLHPQVGARVTFAQIQERLPFGGAIELGLPDHWRTDGTTTWVSNDLDPTPTLYGWDVRILTGWSANGGPWGTPVYASSPRIHMPNYFQGVAAHDNLLLMTGSDPLGTNQSAFILSTDRGQTVPTPTLVPTAMLPNGGALREPLYVAAATPFFLVLEGSYGAPSVLGVHAISPTGVVTPNITAIPSGAYLRGGTVTDAPVNAETKAGKVLIHFGGSNTLVRADFDVAATWTTVPSAADAGHVLGMYRDPSNDDIYAVRDDGTIRRATAAGGWNDWAAFDLGIDMVLPTRAIPHAIGKLPDGRWVALARLFDARPGAANDAPSSIGHSAWLIGPTP